MKKPIYKSISVYADDKENLYFIPMGIVTKLNYDSEIDILTILESPYTINIIEDFIHKTFSQCYSKEKKDIYEKGPLEKHFNVRSYSIAVRGLKLVIINWRKKNGYSIVPMKKIPKQGYNSIEDKKVDLGLNPLKGELSVALIEAINNSITF